MRFARCRRGRDHAQVSYLVEAVPQTVPPAGRGAAALLGRVRVRVANARLDAAAAEQLRHGLSHVAAPQGIDDGVEPRVENS